MRSALVPGSFDPPTNGHLNLIRRASHLFEQIYVVIADNPRKEYLFSSQERYVLLKAMIAGISNADTCICNGLMVDFAIKKVAGWLIRGVRTTDDASYELELAHLNRGLEPTIETVIFPTEIEFGVLRASAVKELVRLGGDVSRMVPPMVEQMLKKKIHARNDRSS